MNKKLIIGVVVVLAVVAIAFFTSKGKNEDADQNTSPSSQQKESDDEGNGQQSLKNLMAKSGNQECTYKDVSTSTTSEGTIYVSSGKMRGDFTTTASGKTTKSHMIIKDSTNFVWTDDSNAGFSMKFDANAQTQAQGPQHGLDPNKNFEFSCKSWSTDSSKFSTPSNITFTDYSSLFNTPPAAQTPNPSINAPDMKSIQMASCDNLPEPQKTQCKSALQ